MKPALGVAVALMVAPSSGTAQGWTQRSPAVRPPGRGFHALAFDLVRSVTVLFGGWDGRPLADTWEWDGSAWTLRRPAVSPRARCCHAMAYDPVRNRVVVFGGTDANVDFDDTWEWDGSSWTQAQPNNKPSRRREVRMTFDPATGRVLLFGGGVGGGGSPVHADTWLWDGNDWALQTPATRPPARWAQGITSDFAGGTVLMYGGANGGISALGDTWRWDGSDWSAQPSSSSPPALTRTALAHDPARQVAVLYGGHGAGTTAWVLDGATWVADARPPAPAPRSTFTMAADLARARAVLFGGFSSSAAYLDDTWEYETSRPASIGVFGTGCAGTAGTPALGASAGSRPILGTTFDLELTNLGAAGPAAITIGTSDRTWNGRALPWDLSGLGMTGCTLHASAEWPFGVPVAGGRAVLRWPLPNDAGLIGVPFFDQGLVVDLSANPLGVIVSNATAGVLGAS